MKKEGDFYDLIEQHANKPCRLFVYNADFDVTREVVIGALSALFRAILVLITIDRVQYRIEIGGQEKDCLAAE